MKDFEVIEYFLTENGEIKGWQIHPKYKRPDLIENPAPLKEMNDGLKDKYGNYLYKLEADKINKINPIITSDQLLDEKARRASVFINEIMKNIINDNITTFEEFITTVKNIAEN